MSPDVSIPSIDGCDIDTASQSLILAGWPSLADNPGHNALVFLSPCGRYIARLAQNDPGFEGFAAMCEAQPTPNLPLFHVNHRSSTGIHLSIMERLKRHKYDRNAEAEKQVERFQGFLWGQNSATSLDASTKKTLLIMLDVAVQLHKNDPRIYEGLDLAAPQSENFLFRQNTDGVVHLVFTDAFARRGCPVSPNWKALRQQLLNDKTVVGEINSAPRRLSMPGLS